MISLRLALARLLAILLLVQWVGGPAHCLLLAAPTAADAFICHVPTGTADDTPAGHTHGAGSAGHECPACHALGLAASLPAPPALSVPLAWAAPLLPAPETAPPRSRARAPPQLPRAPPPSLSLPA